MVLFTLNLYLGSIHKPKEASSEYWHYFLDDHWITILYHCITSYYRPTILLLEGIVIGKAEVTCYLKLSSQWFQKEIYLSSSQERGREHSLPLWGNIFDDALTRHLSVGGTIDPLAMAAVMVGWPLATSVKKVADLGCFSQFGIFLGHVATFSLHFQYQNTQMFSFNNLYFWEWTGNIMIQFVICRATQKRVLKFTLAPLSCHKSRTTDSDTSLFFHLTCNFSPLLLP